jgi:hypothetical protein
MHRYNLTTDLTPVADQELSAFTLSREKCINKTLATNGNNMTGALEACHTDTDFVFNASGRVGCMPDGLGGSQAMNCYTAARTPSMTRRPLPDIACSKCAQWLKETNTLRITAEERIDAGALVTMEFSRMQVELFPPKYGLAANSSTVQVVHFNDLRKVVEREKFRSVCSIAGIRSEEPTYRGCMRPTNTTAFSSPSDSRVSVQSEAGTATQPVVYALQLVAFDSHSTALASTQEPASPVVSMRLEPGIQWDKPVRVAVPMSPGPLVSACRHGDDAC